jgi:hypothetical protein
MILVCCLFLHLQKHISLVSTIFLRCLEVSVVEAVGDSVTAEMVVASDLASDLGSSVTAEMVLKQERRNQIHFWSEIVIVI